MKMIAPRRSGTLIVGLLLSASLAQGQTAEVDRATQVLAPFKRDLREALRAGLTQGHVEAVEACRLGAPEIADSLSRDGVRVGRTSHRLRNPANAAPDWVSPILNAYLESASDRTPRTTALPNGQSGYVEPILTQPLCLTCHGGALAPELAAKIDALYPEDQAVGFEVGDLRGVFWVELPAPR